MSSLTKDHVLEALRTVPDPRGGGDLVSTGAVRSAAACDGFISVGLALAEGEVHEVRARVDSAVRQRAASLGAPVRQLTIERAASTVRQPEGVPMKQGASSPTVKSGSAQPGSPSVRARHIIAVGAGKGGVGKSTVSVNLAVGLARAGHSVGLLDGDIYGPSVPTLMGLDGQDAQMRGTMLQPFIAHGVRTMTIGKLVDPEKPLIWRGPMAHGAFKQLVEQTSWGELDYLIVDLPPGTGDVSLTMAQMLAVSGAVIVCTPQRVAQDDAVRAARMFQALNIPVLGVVENMSYFVGDDGKEYDLFGRGGAEQMAQRLGLAFLGGVPIHTALRVSSDAGDPTANFTGGAALRDALERMVRRVEDEVALASLRSGAGGPVLTVS
ncbi:MAG TPA: sodium:proton antiporter [Phycisphaerales bacterium]|nr:sodium:proton antiporter [Phycisphaerales bacterium]